MDKYPVSPVPSDRDLSEEVLPFTAFGQFGEGNMDNRVFEQDTYWVNVKGEPFLLTEMDSAYRLNVIGFLYDHVEYFHMNAAMREAIGMALSLEEGNPDGALLAHVLGAPAIAELESKDWLESTPLMRKLKALEGLDKT